MSTFSTYLSVHVNSNIVLAVMSLCVCIILILVMRVLQFYLSCFIDMFDKPSNTIKHLPALDYYIH